CGSRIHGRGTGMVSTVSGTGAVQVTVTRGTVSLLRRARLSGHLRSAYSQCLVGRVVGDKITDDGYNQSGDYCPDEFGTLVGLAALRSSEGELARDVALGADVET
ncbi:hypothetical protein PFISCL1PPCAC_4351, partial [Pristionchus fissidentatus]